MATTKKCIKLTFKNLSQGQENIVVSLTFDTAVELQKTIDIHGNNITGMTATMSLTSLVLHKRIGTHNTMTIIGTFVAKTKQDVNNPWSMKEIQDFFMNSTVEMTAKEKESDTTSFSMASSYVVIGVMPTFLNKTVETSQEKQVSYNYSIKLQVASWDYFMDKTPYSRAYTTKRLSAIMSEMVNNTNITNVTKNTASDGMRVLRVDSTKKKSVSKIELLLPYLVQFNETDYSFLKRNATRYGEFLYYERGQLNLGLTKITTKVKEGTTEVDKEVVTELKDATKIAFVGDVGNGDNVANYSFHNAFTNGGYTNDSEGKPYVAEFSNDDYFDVLTKTTYDNYDGWENLQSPQWSRVLSQVLSYDNLVDTAKDITVSELNLQRNQKDRVESANKKFDDKYFTNDSSTNNYETRYAKTDNGKKDEYAEFADIFNKDDIDGNTYIAKVYEPDSQKVWKMTEEEEKRSKEQYTLIYEGVQKDIQLGNIVTVPAIDMKAQFVVVDVMSYSYVKSKVYTTVLRITVVAAKGTETSSSDFKPGNVPVPLPMSKEQLVRRVGAQCAVVTDAMDPRRIGRVRVKYHWQDKNHQDASPWLRVTVPFATDEDSGFCATMNEGDEVMVDYENGNIERPYVVGMLYNGNNRPAPFGQRNYSEVFRSRNGHMIGVREPANAMNILSSFLPGLSIFKMIPGFQMPKALNTQNRSTLRALGGFDITDSYGLYSISTSSDARKISIESPYGNVSIGAAMGITVSAPNGNVKIVGKNVDIVAGNNLTLKSGSNIDSALLSQHSASGMFDALKSAASDTLTSTVTGCFDIPALRFAVELLFKPVAGTLKIHSGRYLLMEAGEGSAKVPHSSFEWRAQPPAGTASTDMLRIIAFYISRYVYYARSYKKAYVNEYKAMCKERASLLQTLLQLPLLQGADVNANTTAINGKIDNWVDAQGAITANDVNGLFQPEQNPIQDGLAQAKAKALKLATAFKKKETVFNQTAANGYAKWEPKDKLTNNGQYHTEFKSLINWGSANWVGNLKHFVADLTNFDEDTLFVANYDIEFKKLVYYYFVTVVGNNKYTGKGTIVRRPVNGVLADITNGDAGNVATSNDWNTLIDTLEIDADNNKPSELRGYFRNDVGMKILNGLTAADSFYNVWSWDKDTKGSILISQEKGKTVKIEGSGLKLEPTGLADVLQVLRNANLK